MPGASIFLTAKDFLMKAHFKTGAFILRTCLLASSLFAGAAFAADLRRYEDVPPQPHAPLLTPVPISQWSGQYVGGSLGYLGLLTENPKVEGFELGARAGYDQQFGDFVIGAMVEGDLSFAKGSVAGYKFESPFKLGGYGRLGYKLSPEIIGYVLTGFSYLDVKVKSNKANPPEAAMGFGLGFGVERKISQFWSVFGEYRYHRLWSEGNLAVNVLEAKVGVNYRFGSDQHPLFARY